MRKLLRKLRQLLVNAALLLVTACAVATILIPDTALYSRIFWMGCAVLFVLVIPFKRKILKKTYIDKDGYRVFTSSGDYVHRYVAKKTLRRKLRHNEVVHHINGRKSDNRLTNLCVMDRHQHELVHAWLDWKKKKTGNYPSIDEQKRALQDKHNGILLENHPTVKFKSPSRVRHKFILNRHQDDKKANTH